MPPEGIVVTTRRRKTGFAGDVLKLASGAAIAQVLGIISAPLLTRIFVPSAWGVLAIFVSITGILQVIACMRYEFSIMLPERDDDAVNLLGVSLAFAVLVSLLTTPLLWWWKDHILRWLNAPGLAPYLWLIPFMVFIHGVFLALNYWNSRTRNFGRLSIARVTSSLATTVGKLGFGYAGYATAGTLIGATVAGQAISTAVLGGQIWKDDRKIFLKSIHWKGMLEGIIRYKEFPLLNTWSSLMNIVSSQLAPLMLAVFFSTTIVGFFALGHRLLLMPAALIGRAIAQVFFQRSSKAKYDGTLPLVVGKTVSKLMLLGLFPILLVMIAGKDFFSVIFGYQWAEAGVYAQILAPWILFQFLSSPITTLLAVLEMQGESLLFNVILLVTRIASLLIGGFVNNILIALLLFSITGAIIYFGLLVFLLRKACISMSVLFQDSLRMGMIGFIILLPIAILKGFSIQASVIVMTGCLALIIYYIILYFQDKELNKLVSGLIPQRKGSDK